MTRRGSAVGQALRGVAVFWLVLLTCSIPAVAVVAAPVLLYVLIKTYRVRRGHKALREHLVREVRMAQHAARMKAWG